MAFSGGMEEEKEQRPFRINSQVGVVVMITMLALFLPLAGVVLFASGYFKHSAATAGETAAVASPSPRVDGALRASLEAVADAKLAAKPLAEKGAVLEVPVGEEEVAVQSVRIEALAKMAGGESLRMAEPAGALLRMGAVVPVSRVELFRRAVGSSERVDFSGVAASEEREFIEIRFIHAAGRL